MFTLSSPFRPLRGGYLVAYGPGTKQCTLGFIALIDEGSGEQAVAVVNSHCTAVETASDAGPIYQSTWNTSAHLIGPETRDPPPFACVENPLRGCRHADAALVRLTTPDFDFGYIARTTASDPLDGSTFVSLSNPRFKIAAESPLFMGMTLSKVGITTGWTTGMVDATCVDVTPTVPVPSFTRLCNGEVEAGGDLGDSGSPDFRELGEVGGEPTVALHGLMWGASAGGTRFVFSQTQYIREDLGLFTTHEGQVAPSPF